MEKVVEKPKKNITVALVVEIVVVEVVILVRVIAVVILVRVIAAVVKVKLRAFTATAYTHTGDDHWSGAGARDDSSKSQCNPTLRYM